MPVPLDLQSERFSATGGAAAEGVSNQLGRPRADRFTLLIREAVQNSWDARLQTVGGVQFAVEGYVLKKEARRALASTVFAKVPEAVDIGARLLGPGDFPVLAISDAGTRGLCGPTRGDVVPAPGEPTNFVDFMRYIGRPPNRPYGGGTYGFGKAAYFLASSMKTICVHTRFRKGGGMQSRFMASALGPQFETRGRTGGRFTGRHWWGRSSKGTVEPVTGAEADRLARHFHGARRSAGESGTTVFVLAPDFQDDEPQAVLSDMRQAILDYFWPKLIDGPDQTATMSFSVRWEGRELPLPNVMEAPDFSLLARAFLAAAGSHNEDGLTVHTIASQRPSKLLGRLAIVRRPPPRGSQQPPTPDGRVCLYERELHRPLRHVAVMRAPNFVVKYVQGPAVPYEMTEYAGVFRVDAEVDRAFARAEPPTHDDWIPDLLIDAAEKTCVRVAERRIRESIEAFAAPQPIAVSGGGTASVAEFSRLLGGLVPALGAPVSRSGRANPPAGDGRRPRAGRAGPAVDVSFVGEPSLELIDGAPAMVARFQVAGELGASVRVTAAPRVVIAGGFENDPPEGAEQPQVIKWMRPGGRTAAANIDWCDVAAGGGVWAVAVSIPPDAMISVSLKAQQARPS